MLRQNKHPKLASAAYKALKSILRSKTVRVGEKQRIVVAKRISKTKSNRSADAKEARLPLERIPICCLADIPIIHLGYHASRYGKFALGFHRDKAIHAGFSPVFYQLESSPIMKDMYDTLYLLREMSGPHTASTIPTKEEILQCPSPLAGKLAVMIVGLEEMVHLHIEGHKHAAARMEQIFGYIKAFEMNEFDSIYCEREWRLTKPYVFDFPDIAMIVVPKKVQKAEYFSPFLEFANEIELPRRIPIVAWEDLVEH